MTTCYKLGLTALVGAFVGVFGVGAISAQPIKTPQAYVISEANAITDPAAVIRYGQEVGKTLAPFEGRYRFIVGGGKVHGLDGEAPQGVVVIAFDTVADARAWYDSAAYQAIKPIREGSVRGRLYIAEGVMPQ